MGAAASIQAMEDIVAHSFDDDSPDITPDEMDDSSEYWNEFNALFVTDAQECLRHINDLAFNGELHTIRFRSIVWKIFLGTLTHNYRQWKELSKFSRQHYSALKEKYTSIQHSEELLRDIEQDVVRTFPDYDFFQDSSIRKVMKDILIVYSQEYEDISYKQGMHELLGPLLYVLAADHNHYLEAVRANCKMKSVLQVVMNHEFLEHDAYILFVQLMKSAGVWFQYDESFFRQIKAKFRRMDSPCDSNSAVVRFISNTWDKHFRYHDPDVYAHLNKNDIQPHIFGIRWLRLMFSREFGLIEVLRLWDGVFAYSSNLNLINYIFIAILILQRKELLNSDSNACLRILLKHPKNLKVHIVLTSALHLANPKKFDRPLSLQLPNKAKMTASLQSLIGFDRSPTKKKVTPRSRSFFNLSSSFDISDQASDKSDKRSSLANIFTRKPSFNSIDSVDYKNEWNLLSAKCSYCAAQLESHISTLQSVVQENQSSDEQLFVSLAGLKQVRDILNGSLKLSPKYINDETDDPFDLTGRSPKILSDKQNSQTILSGRNRLGSGKNSLPISSTLPSKTLLKSNSKDSDVRVGSLQ